MHSAEDQTENTQCTSLIRIRCSNAPSFRITFFWMRIYTAMVFASHIRKSLNSQKLLEIFKQTLTFSLLDTSVILVDYNVRTLDGHMVYSMAWVLSWQRLLVLNKTWSSETNWALKFLLNIRYRVLGKMLSYYTKNYAKSMHMMSVRTWTHYGQYPDRYVHNVQRGPVWCKQLQTAYILGKPTYDRYGPDKYELHFLHSLFL